MAEPQPLLLGPVSAGLEAELRSEIRRYGIVVWLDKDRHYSGFVDRLSRLRAAGELPYQVVGYRGSHLELMFALEGLAGGSEKPPLLIHMPGFVEETVAETPLLELYEAGKRFRKALDTLVRETAGGRVRPEKIADFLSGPDLTLEAADAWLAGELEVAEGGLAAELRAMTLPALVDDLLSGGHVAGQLAEGVASSVASSGALWQQLATRTGVREDWRDALLPGGPARGPDVAFVTASWALCVEYVHDLRRAPYEPRLAGLAELPAPVVDACRGLADHLRDRHREFYLRTADEIEDWLEVEVSRAVAADLGKIDTFRFEADKLLRAALAELEAGKWETVLGWAGPRLEKESVWLRVEPARRSTWQLVAAAARLGQALEVAGPRLGQVAETVGPRAGQVRSLEEAVKRYVEKGVAVDQAHRHLEQQRTALLYPQIPEFEALRERLDGIRERWRTWADAWARDFSGLCRKNGILPDSSQQQRTLFDQVVRPFTQENGPTAYFVVDAFRYEMAEELRASLEGTPACTVLLKARLAELPSITDVGMNVLAPVAPNGRLRPVISGIGSSMAITGFQTGEFKVSRPDSRQRAMMTRVGGATCPWLSLSEVVAREAGSLKQTVARANLVVVHSTEIDDAGETGAGTAVFDLVMQKLRAAWRLLREAGVQRFVFTADHGFLLLDERSGQSQSHGRKVDPKRRHVISSVAADHPGELRVPLADLDYDDVAGLQLMFPETTAVFDTGDRKMSFVHGGNSLQERVIPVLTVVHRSAAGGSGLTYAVTAEAGEGVAGMHCLEAVVEMTAQGGLPFGGRKEIELALRVKDLEGASVELCQTRRGARLEGGAIYATVGKPFELFFRLTGPEEARVRIELHHPNAAAQVTACVVDGRFAVAAMRGVSGPKAGDRSAERESSEGGIAENGRMPGPENATAKPGGSAAELAAQRAWLEDLPVGGVRQLFEHLAVHGVVTEAEATEMLGGPSRLRRFSMHFEEYAARAPFIARIDVVGGVKRYVREGSSR